MYKNATSHLLLVTVVTLFLIFFNNVSNTSAQNSLSNTESEFSGVDNYDISQANIVYNFNERAENSEWNYIQYPYARFYAYNSYLIVNSVVNSYISYPRKITCGYPYGFGAIGVSFYQPVHNLSFSVVAGDPGGSYKVDIYKNGQLSQTLTLPTTCSTSPACFVDLRGYTNVSGVDLYAINDDLGISFDDFSFALGANPTPTPTPTPTPNQAPVGVLEGVRENGNAYGWTRDPDNLNVSNAVQFFVDGAKGIGTLAGQVIANIPRADVGNHVFEFIIPIKYRDGKPHTLYAYGQDITAGKPDTLLTNSPKTFTLHPNVQNLSFEPITNEVLDNKLTNSEIEVVPGTDGQRIFPDKKNPEDTNNRKRVRVKAVISPVVAGAKIYFRNFDVDDPSSEIDIDENGNGGNDNREGRIIDAPYPPAAAGTISASCTGTQGLSCAVTDNNGVATVDFTVTKQPGDNFVVAASSDEAYLKGVNVNGTGLKDSTNASLPTAQANRTKLLTVWRKLYMEVDSMGEVEGNFVTGYLREKGLQIGNNAQVIEVTPSEGPRADHSYQERVVNGTRRSYGGRIVFSGGQNFQVLDNNTIYAPGEGFRASGGQRINVQSLTGGARLRPNHPFVLYDDDDFNDDDNNINDTSKPGKDGDNGENVELLPDSLSLMQPSSDINTNLYAAAYIMPEYLWAEGAGFNNSNVPFELYSPCTLPDCEEQRTRINAHRGSQTSESDDFWVGYLLVSYQGDRNSDVDPGGFFGGVAPMRFNNSRNNGDYYNPTVGVPPGGIGAVIFIEAMRDYAASPFTTVIPGTPVEQIVTLARTRVPPHEVGHQFGLAHGGGVMGYTEESLRFIPNHINMMRWRVRSPGEGE